MNAIRYRIGFHRYGDRLDVLGNLPEPQATFDGPDWFHVALPRHLFHFDRPFLATILDEANSTVERWSTFSLESHIFEGAREKVDAIAYGRKRAIAERSFVAGWFS